MILLKTSIALLIRSNIVPSCQDVLKQVGDKCGKNEPNDSGTNHDE